jgi:hypothetical protein
MKLQHDKQVTEGIDSICQFYIGKYRNFCKALKQDVGILQVEDGKFKASMINIC